MTIAPEVATISESIESRNATFRLTATSVTPPDTSTVTVSVMISQEGDFLASLDPANINRRVPVPKGGSDTFTVAIAPDNDDEPDGKIIATLVPDTTDTPVYSVGAAPAHRAEVAVTDDDETFSITATANESEGDNSSENKTMEFAVTLSAAIGQTASVSFQVGKFGDTADIDDDYSVKVGDSVIASEFVTADGQTVRAAQGILRFETGSPLTQTITIDIVEDLSL